MQQYLTRYAEPETALLESLAGHWQHALIIPAYKEDPGFLAQTLPADCLLILVLNRPPNDTDTAWAHSIMQSLPAPSWQAGHLSLHLRPENSALLVVDRCLQGQPIPAKQGVGLARKIGADIACQLLATDTLQSPWLACTDADALLPADYWTALQRQDDKAAACVFPFTHQRETDAADAIRCYELHMLYYVAGLRFAASPYAWPTIGSCIAVNAKAYTQARGYPKKAGGEDFYLLNKLAKLGGVRHLSGPTITLNARLSDRVPFGTGPALRKIQLLETTEDFCSYHPQSFAYLKAAIAGLVQSSQADAASSARQIADNHGLNGEWFNQLWQDFGCDNAIALARKNSRSAAQIQRHLMTWFDSFRSLKWMHACRRWLPDQALARCINEANWLTLVQSPATTADQRLSALQEYLADNRLRGSGLTQTNEATSTEFIDICGH